MNLIKRKHKISFNTIVFQGVFWTAIATSCV